VGTGLGEKEIPYSAEIARKPDEQASNRVLKTKSFFALRDIPKLGRISATCYD
jgi:hypothetical protein